MSGGRKGDESSTDESSNGWRRRPILQALGAGSALSVVGAGAAAADEHTDEDGVDPDDGRLRCGDWREGALTEDDETGLRSDQHHQDTYPIDARAGDTLRVNVDLYESSASPYLYLLDPDGEVIAESAGAGDRYHTFVEHRIETDGEYTAVVTSDEPESFFEYEVYVNCFRGEGELRCGDRVREALTEDDETGFRSDQHYHDTYTFQGTVGDTIFLDMWVEGDEDGNGEGSFPYLYLLDPNGNVVAEGDEGFEWDSFLSYDIELAGEYTILATSLHEETFFEYDLFVECFRPPPSIECGETVWGSLDDALFESEHVFQAQARDEVTVRVTAADEDVNPYLLLLDSDWNVVAQDDDSGEGLNPLIEDYTIQRPGQYTIIVAGYWDDFFEYELELTCEEGPPLETEPIECGEVVNGALTENDETGFRGTAPFDAYSIRCSPDTFLAISMATDEGDPYLYLLDPDGNVVAEDDDSGGGLNSLIAYRTDRAGEFTIIATSLWGGFGEFPEFEDGNGDEPAEEGDVGPFNGDHDDEFPGSFFEYELELVCCRR